MRHLGQEQHVPPDTSGPASLQLATGPAFPRLPEPPPHKYRLPDRLIRVDQRACSSRQARLSPACPNHLHTNTACPIASYESSSDQPRNTQLGQLTLKIKCQCRQISLPLDRIIVDSSSGKCSKSSARSRTRA